MISKSENWPVLNSLEAEIKLKEYDANDNSREHRHYCLQYITSNNSRPTSNNNTSWISWSISDF